MIQWKEGVNKTVLRNGTSWNDVTGFISDTTRSGKRKRRLSPSIEKRVFSVRMRFSITEYNLFRDWYENETLRGLVSFEFPKIDSIDQNEMSEYQFTEKGYPKYVNNGGHTIDCTMEWEEK